LEQEIFEVEREALKRSRIHALDPRVKLLTTLLIISAAVAIGRSDAVEVGSRLLSLALLQAYILTLAFLAGLRMRLFLMRVGVILPFGGGIALLKPFFEPGEVLFSFYFVKVTREGAASGAVLLAVVILCASAVVLLSSTTRMQALIAGLRSFRLPGEVVLLLGMTVRFLFLYLRSLQEIVQAQRNRCFALRGRRVRRGHVLRVLGYTAAMIFIRAYRHGEAVYQAMLSRGYSAERLRLSAPRKVGASDWAFALASIAVVALSAWVALS